MTIGPTFKHHNFFLKNGRQEAFKKGVGLTDIKNTAVLANPINTL